MARALEELVQRITATAERWSPRTALTFLDSDLSERSYTFAEMLEVTDKLRHRFRQAGIGRSGPVGILLESQEAQILHYIGALRAGAVPAILTPPNRKLNAAYYARTMRAVLQRADFETIISDIPTEEWSLHVVSPWTLTPAPHSSREVPGPKDPLPSAPFLQFSSGTTGMKRGVEVRNEAVCAQLQAYADAISLTSEDRIISWLPLYHDMGFIACLNMPLVHGVHTIMLDPIDWVTDPALFIIAVHRFRGTLAWLPNFAFAFMAQRVMEKRIEGVDLSSLRGLVNCSEPVTAASQQQFLERFSPYDLREDVFLGCYAMAETTFALTHGESRDPSAFDAVGPIDAHRDTKDPSISVGKPLPGVKFRIVDEFGTDLPDRHTGEVWVRSPFTFTRYVGDAEATETAFHGDWYRTGDLGYRVGDELFIPGRKKDVLIVGGVNVFPADIEELMSECPGVVAGRVSVFAIFDPRRQTERIVALAESKLEGNEATRLVTEIRQRLLAAFQIANYAVHLVPPGWLVKSSSGKMARSANREKWQTMQGT